MESNLHSSQPAVKNHAKLVFQWQVSSCDTVNYCILSKLFPEMFSGD